MYGAERWIGISARPSSRSPTPAASAAAAKRLHASHPTVSRKIAALEAQLGTKLLARAADGFVLTADGRTLREHAEAMAAAALRAEAAVCATGESARGVVKLSIGATLASHRPMPRRAVSPRT